MSKETISQTEGLCKEVATCVRNAYDRGYKQGYKDGYEEGHHYGEIDGVMNVQKDDLDNLIVDHTCEKKQEQTRDEKMIDAIDFAIKATDSQDDYSMGMRNGMRYVKSLIDGKEPQYELRQTDEEIKLGIDLGDEVIDDYGAKGVVVGMDTYKDEVLLSLLMRNHKVPQLVKASGYKTKTGRHFNAIEELLKQL